GQRLSEVAPGTPVAGAAGVLGVPRRSAARDIRSRNGHDGLGAVVKGASERTMGPRPAWPSGPGARSSLPHRPSSLPGAAMEPFDLDTGATAWILTSAALVLLMPPGLSLFHGGMVRTAGGTAPGLPRHLAGHGLRCRRGAGGDHSGGRRRTAVRRRFLAAGGAGPGRAVRDGDLRGADHCDRRTARG